jgi:hypothetical protein
MNIFALICEHSREKPIIAVRALLLYYVVHHSVDNLFRSILTYHVRIHHTL